MDGVFLPSLVSGAGRAVPTLALRRRRLWRRALLRRAVGLKCAFVGRPSVSPLTFYHRTKK